MYENTVLPGDLELFNPERWPKRPYCTDDLERGLRIRSLRQALEKVYIQANPPHMRIWSLYDVDKPGAALAWEAAGLPQPSWLSVNTQNAHAHLVYGLSAPVLVASMEARQAPLRYLNAVEAAFRAKLQADDGYSGLITKNPAHPLWRSCRGCQMAYDLGELAAHVDLRQFKARQGVKVAEVGLGRNVTTFDFARLWAYKNVRDYKAGGDRQGFVYWQADVYGRCMNRNADFPQPMNYREVHAIAKSVAKWTWSRFDLAASDARFSALQAARSAFQRSKKGLFNA
jgi:hypothetical protein